MRNLGSVNLKVRNDVKFVKFELGNVKLELRNLKFGSEKRHLGTNKAGLEKWKTSI